MTRDHDSSRIRELMMAELDDEITDDERRRLQEHLHEDPEAAREWERLHQVKEVTTTMTPRQPSDEVWQTYWHSVYSRLERGVGWILFSVGIIVLAGYGIITALEAMFRDTTVPTVVRVAVLLSTLGLAILMISVVREKVFVNRNDSYKDVTR